MQKVTSNSDILEIKLLFDPSEGTRVCGDVNWLKIKLT